MRRESVNSVRNDGVDCETRIWVVAGPDASAVSSGTVGRRPRAGPSCGPVDSRAPLVLRAGFCAAWNPGETGKINIRCLAANQADGDNTAPSTQTKRLAPRLF